MREHLAIPTEEVSWPSVTVVRPAVPVRALRLTLGSAPRRAGDRRPAGVAEAGHRSMGIGHPRRTMPPRWCGAGALGRQAGPVRPVPGPAWAAGGQTSASCRLGARFAWTLRA